MNNESSTKTIQLSWYLLFFAWILAISGTLLSLFFSEVVQVPVCVLCWYQRIALYPLALILPLALFPYDPRVVRYGGVLVIFGWFTALFHVLLISEIIPQDLQPCVEGIPCTETHINLLGFVNIPIMALLTFTLIGILLIYSNIQHNSEPS